MFYNISIEFTKFCRKNCMPEISSKVTPISVNKLRKEEFHCSCKEPKYDHQSFQI